MTVPQGAAVSVPDTGRERRLCTANKEANTAHARLCGRGERANARLRSWMILRKILLVGAGGFGVDRWVRRG
ncbi:hypothetical protein GCM10023321_50050 [Pseudonocardia eucalypti]|uniref:Uncharacterized protein n=1 Tax=Pseudonocardia eucalypti TaxID=648755 RepID=A0ABP9QKR0_9PSEU